MVLLVVISLVPRGSVNANDGAVTYYAQYGCTLDARAAAEARNHGAGLWIAILVVLLGLRKLYEGYI